MWPAGEGIWGWDPIAWRGGHVACREGNKGLRSYSLGGGYVGLGSYSLGGGHMALTRVEAESLTHFITNNEAAFLSASVGTPVEICVPVSELRTQNVHKLGNKTHFLLG